MVRAGVRPHLCLPIVGTWTVLEPDIIGIADGHKVNSSFTLFNEPHPVISNGL